MTSQLMIDKRGLIVGFLALSVSTIIAYRNPTTGYELSIYAGTPVLFWLGVVIAIFVSLSITLFSNDLLIQKISMILGGFTMTVITSLPVIRGYHYYGSGDALTHLGFGIDILSRNSGLLDNLYFGMHTIAVSITLLTDLNIKLGFMFIPVVFAILFIVFEYLLIHAILPKYDIKPIAFLSVILLLPLNQVSRAGVFNQPYPTMAALFFLPVVFFTMLLYDRDFRVRSVLLILSTSLTIIFLHPQQAANLFLLLCAVVGFKLAIHLVDTESVSTSKSLFVPTLILGSVLWLWMSARARFERSLSHFIVSLLSETETTGDVSEVSVSLVNIGSSIEVLFLKLFFVSLIFCLMAGSLMIWYIIRLYNPEYRKQILHHHRMPIYLTIGFSPIFGLFIGYIVYSSQYFRHLGFIMVIVTILGAIALYNFVNYIGNNKITKVALGGIFIIFIAISIMTLHMSPFIYQANPQVSEGEMSGYEFTIDTIDKNELILFVRSSPNRYADGIYGESKPPLNTEGSPDHFADQNLTEVYDQKFYLTITAADRLRDPILYRGFRFSTTDFEYLDRNSELQYIYDNEQFDLYYANESTSKDVVD